MPNPRILILTASTGSGHISAAHAIQIEAERRAICVGTEDVLDHCSKAFKTWYAGGYEYLVRKKPAVWGHLYRTSDRPLFNFWFQTYLDWRFCAPLDNLIDAFSPDWIVCTHSLPQPRLKTLQKTRNFKTAVMVTDVYPHRMWLRGHVDRYFVPVEKTKTILQSRLPKFAGQIDVVGMPIRSGFGVTHLREISSEPIVLLTAGGIGGGPVSEAATALAGLPIELRVVCGYNKPLYAELSARFEGAKNITVLGLQSQEDMAELLRNSDLIVSKSGGLSTFEAIASGCAFVVLHDLLIPGQEEGNADFLNEIGAGVSVKSVSGLSAAVSALVSDRDKILAMQQAGLRHAMPHAAKTIVDMLTAE